MSRPSNTPGPQGRLPRVMLLSDTFEYGGAERHTASLALALLEAGYEVRLVAVKDKGALLKEERFGELRTRSTNCGGVRFADLAALQRLRREVAEFAPDVLLCSNFYAQAYGAMTGCQTRGVRLVGVCHSTKLRNAKEEWQARLIYRRQLRQFDALVFLCQYQANVWRDWGLTARQTPVIYNGIDLQRFHPGLVAESREAKRCALGFESSDVVVACNAMLRPEKNHQQLLEALRIMRGMGYPIKALIIGDGSEGKRLQALCESWGLSDSVRFAGRVSNVEELLVAADVGVLPSVAIETFSLAALETMALGIPMVISDQGGAKEMVQHGREGWVVRTGELADLVAAMAAMCDAGRRAEMGANASQRVHAQFGNDMMVSSYRRLLLDLCTGR